jgi:hypothetical protein
LHTTTQVYASSLVALSCSSASLCLRFKYLGGVWSAVEERNYLVYVRLGYVSLSLQSEERTLLDEMNEKEITEIIRYNEIKVVKLKGSAV